MNTAVHVRSLAKERRVTLHSALGRDEFGTFLRRAVAQRGVELRAHSALAGGRPPARLSSLALSLSSSSRALSLSNCFVFQLELCVLRRKKESPPLGASLSLSWVESVAFWLCCARAPLLKKDYTRISLLDRDRRHGRVRGALRRVGPRVRDAPRRRGRDARARPPARDRARVRPERRTTRRRPISGKETCSPPRGGGEENVPEKKNRMFREIVCGKRMFRKENTGVPGRRARARGGFLQLQRLATGRGRDSARGVLARRPVKSV